MSERTVNVLDGSTFVVGDRLGDIRTGEGREHGFFSDDTRFISRCVLGVAGLPLELLSINQSAHLDAQFFLTPTVGPDDQAPCSVIRHRFVDEVWMEQITLTNHFHQASRMRVTLDVDADFADLFEVKDGEVAERDISFTHDDTCLTLAYSNGEFHRSVTVTSSAPAAITRSGFAYDLRLGPGEQWSTSLTIVPESAQPGLRFQRRRTRGSLQDARTARLGELETWIAGTPTLQTDDPALLRTYQASLSDLGALRMHPTSPTGRRCRPPDCRGSWRCSDATA